MKSILKLSVFVGGMMCVLGAFATTWTGGGSDSLFDPLNWGGTELGTANDAVFYNSDDLSLRLAEDYTAKRMFFYGAGHVAIDLQGNTVSFTGGDVQVNANNANAEIHGGGKMTVSGTLRISSGAASNCSMLIRDTGTFVYPNAILIGQTAGGSFNTLIVSNGAHFAVNTGIPIANASNSVSSNNCLIVTGEGSEAAVSNAAYAVEVGWQACGGNNMLEVTDKGLLYCGKTIVGGVTNCYNNLLYVHDGGTYTNCGDFVMGNVAGASSNRVLVADGGWFYVKDNFQISANACTGNVFTVSNARVYSGKQITLCGNNASIDNELRIVNGGGFESANKLNFAWMKDAEGNRLVLSNGSFKVTSITAGKNDPSYVLDNRIMFCGTNDMITVTGNDFSLKSGTILEIDFPPEGRNVSAVCLTGAGSLNLDGTMRIYVDATKLVRRLGAKTTYPLVRVANVIADTALDHLTLSPAEKVSVAFTSDGKGIDVTVKPDHGLFVVVR